MKTFATKNSMHCAVLCALLISPLRGVHAQATTGVILGQVTDSTGAVIQGATVTAKDENKGITFTGPSDDAGNYIILNVTLF